MENWENLSSSNPDQIVILVADDEVAVRNLVRIMLQAEGFFILAAANGEEALEISRKYHGIIHALISNVKMPEMDGLELRERILTERPGIKVLLMSGEIECPVEGIPFLRKP